MIRLKITDNRRRAGSSKVLPVDPQSPIGQMFSANPSTRKVEVTNHMNETVTYERMED